MARYTGPKLKVSRKFGEPVLGGGKALQKKNYPPGMHGRGRKRKQSEYAVQLAEKQKVKYTYGVLERQFAKTFDKAARKGGITGENLLKLLEARIDNTVYRLGLASTRRAARQLVLHRHITINGEVVNIPSYSLKPGDVISVRERSRSLEVVTNAVAARGTKRYPWLEMDLSTLTGKFVTFPLKDELPENFNVQLIVELYSK